jgi:hypothetical protein
MFTIARRFRAGVLTLALVGVAALTTTAPQSVASAASGEPANSVGSTAAYEGKRVRTAKDPAVWLVMCGVRRWIPDEVTYNNIFRDWSGIRTITDREIDSIPTGKTLRNASLVKGTDPRVFFVHDNTKYYIKSEAAFNAWNFDWSEIALAEQVVLNRMTNGCHLS